MTAIEPCPEIAIGRGRLVVSRFRHSHGEVYDLRLVGSDGIIGVTAQHPLWSATRGVWVSAAELELGERLSGIGQTADRGVGEGTGVVVEVASLLPRGQEPVYNIEVDADHCYRVGEQGLLVHNASVGCETKCQKDGKPDPGLPNPNPVGELYAALYGTDSVPVMINTEFNKDVQVVKIIALNRSRHADGRVHSDDPNDPFQILRSGPLDLYREEFDMGLVRWEDDRMRFLVWVADGIRVDLVRLPGPRTGDQRRGRQVAVVDHILSGNKGGSNSYCNARVISKTWNSKKGQNPIEDI
ncbi:hypothetical protein [Tuwongella immobilis]|uniref:Uncharacterized protein n=1 Tax=Tuwongella immobilis TaxID=692036 RepID=A0A6C2YQU3_9BACT|nr:hypothetical protein [Tuwongella immobilis]VIP03727.1 Uncharacterized protein OS=Planctomyces maris DSM 8797 GN=PM8797T_02039 PE=4 SV=1: PT-HINT [Tuwongella immobilis]VTS04822.1 Uncharacterized protein OS=Planctomyces maris DSM 8797 GN=PM8797T_02039 PE=4 SV=1: PT-HINT [Tuwongella immobilis]